MKTILITGGAGFIGSHLADELLRAGHRVRALDNLTPQVHGEMNGSRKRPSYLSPEIELHIGDVRDRAAVDRALQGVDAVVHFASIVGVGQSMYAVEEYTSVNNVGTAVLLEAMLASKRSFERLLVASSMSVYGEGLYRNASGAIESGHSRTFEQLKRADWEVRGKDGKPLEPIPTPESKTVCLESIYALSKYDQERMCLLLGRAYGIPTVAMRFFNTYGPRQALSNPYTGVMAIFASRLMNGNPPLVFEDGRQQRDFVSVYDVARACRLALDAPDAVGKVLNVGSGKRRTIVELAEHMARALGKPGIAPDVTGKCRVGDVRHCFPDITEATRTLDFAPAVDFDRGLIELAAWLEGQVAKDRVAEMRAELDARGLTL